MPLLIATNDGVYRASSPQFEDVTRVLDPGRTMRVRTFPESAEPDAVFACTKTGLYRSRDGGTSWTDLNVPREEVYAVLRSPDGNRLYAGTHPAHCYVSEDAGETWRELTGLQELPSREDWYTPRHRDEAHVRSLGAHPAEPDRVVAGVEVGGVHVSDDRGERWQERKNGLHDDVHHVLVRNPDTYVASCGDGLYRTADAGRSWTRLDEGLSRRYFREATVHEGRLYAAAARSSPGTWSGDGGADAALYVSDDGEGFTSVAYPGGPAAVILAWASDGDPLVAGTNEGRVLVNTDTEWKTGGRVPDGIRSLCRV